MTKLLDYYKELIDLVIVYKYNHKYDLVEILQMLHDDDIDMISLVYHQY